MKLQADSNYLLSKEYEVQLGLRDALAILVLRISLPTSLLSFSLPYSPPHGVSRGVTG